MLGNSHAVDTDDGARIAIDVRRRFDIGTRQSRFVFNLPPIAGADLLHEIIESARVLRDETDVEQVTPGVGVLLFLSRQNMIAHAHQRGDVPARLHLVILARNLG